MVLFLTFSAQESKPKKSKKNKGKKKRERQEQRRAPRTGFTPGSSSRGPDAHGGAAAPRTSLFGDPLDVPPAFPPPPPPVSARPHPWRIRQPDLPPPPRSWASAWQPRGTAGPQAPVFTTSTVRIEEILPAEPACSSHLDSLIVAIPSPDSLPDVSSGTMRF